MTRIGPLREDYARPMAKELARKNMQNVVIEEWGIVKVEKVENVA